MSNSVRGWSKTRNVWILCVTSIGVLLAPLLTGCVNAPFSELKDPIDNVVNELEKYRGTIESESSGWRDELPKLVNSLGGIESQVSGDVKGVIADTTNQVQDLATQSIQFGDAKAQDLMGQAGVEFRCNAGFVKAGVTSQLQYLIDDLKFWKLNGRHLDKQPTHAVCWINPTSLALYPSGSNWLIDTSNMSEKNIIHVFGYNFRSDAMPVLELRDANGAKLRDAVVQATYVTHYQINLDFSAERFPELRAGMQVEFRWPDQSDPNHINLTMMPPARLRISDPIFDPATPTAERDAVILQVTVTNDGGLRSGNTVITWKPDPIDPNVVPITLAPLEAQQSRTVSFPGYKYQRAGDIKSVVALNNGDFSLPTTVKVLPPVPITDTFTLKLTSTFEVMGAGGEGGTEKTITCATNTVATGLVIRRGGIIDQIGLQCRKLPPNGATEVPVPSDSMGGLGGSAETLSCPPNMALHGISGQAGRYVDRIMGHCHSLTGPETFFNTGSTGGSGGSPFDAECPDDYFVTGIVGRYGGVVDQININCTEVVKN